MIKFNAYLLLENTKQKDINGNIQTRNNKIHLSPLKDSNKTFNASCANIYEKETRNQGSSTFTQKHFLSPANLTMRSTDALLYKKLIDL